MGNQKSRVINLFGRLFTRKKADNTERKPRAGTDDSEVEEADPKNGVDNVVNDPVNNGEKGQEDNKGKTKDASKSEKKHKRKKSRSKSSTSGKKSKKKKSAKHKNITAPDIGPLEEKDICLDTSIDVCEVRKRLCAYLDHESELEMHASHCQMRNKGTKSKPTPTTTANIPEVQGNVEKNTQPPSSGQATGCGPIWKLVSADVFLRSSLPPTKPSGSVLKAMRNKVGSRSARLLANKNVKRLNKYMNLLKYFGITPAPGLSVLKLLRKRESNHCWCKHFLQSSYIPR